MPLIAAVIAVAVAAGVATQRRLGARAGTLARRLLALMLYALVPPVVFFNLVHLRLTADVGGGIVLAWVSVAIVGVLAHVTGARVLRLPRPQTGTLINAALHPNTGYLGLPVCAAALGTESLDRAVAYDTLVGTPTLLLGVFAVGAAYGTQAGRSARERTRAFVTRNPPLIAAVLGLLAPAALAPDVLVDASRVVVFALLPLGFFAVGVTLAEEGVRFPPPLEPRTAAALALRLLVAPALLLALAAPLIDLPAPYLILAAMPTGLNGLVVAHAYGLDLAFAAGAIAWGTALVVVAATVIALVA
ncbi:MAG: AEC family transporter [Solirubrobacteraceae bacterium]